MPVLSTHKDLDSLTLTVVSEHDADVARLWQIWEDPRQLERWWGPPTWPATFTEHDLTPGGRSSYSMTGPDGEKDGGWWKILAVDAPRSVELEDGFADDGQGVPTTDTTRSVITLEPVDGRTRMTMVTTFSSVEHLESLVAMGMEQGLSEAMSQIDGLLAEV